MPKHARCLKSSLFHSLLCPGTVSFLGCSMVGRGGLQQGTVAHTNVDMKSLMQLFMEYLLEIWADDKTQGNWIQILENSTTFFLIVGARGIRFMQEKNLRKKFGENTPQT